MFVFTLAVDLHCNTVCPSHCIADHLCKALLIVLILYGALRDPNIWRGYVVWLDKHRTVHMV